MLGRHMCQVFRMNETVPRLADQIIFLKTQVQEGAVEQKKKHYVN